MQDSETQQTPPPQPTSKLGAMSFTRTFVLPAFTMFLIPALGLAFFLHAQDQYDQTIRHAMREQIEADQELTAEEKREQLLIIEQVEIASLIDAGLLELNSGFLFEYNTFRWMIIAARVCLFSGVAVFLFGGLTVLLSLRSQRMQYLCLSFGWQLLQVVGTLQVICQGILLVALSYWVTALWLERYVPKLILVVAIAAFAAACFVIAAIFKRPKLNVTVEGEVIEADDEMPLWQEIRSLADRVGTDPPDHIIAGIDTNFFVIELPVHIGERTLTGRTLFVSLSLLKQLDGEEADAVLAHELAHFSGQDTYYSKKIAPMLARFDQYLAALHDNILVKPVFYFMMCFRGLFELSLGRQSREREYRADRVAAEVVSPKGLAGALARIAAYAVYRGQVETELFETEDVLETADISRRIETGFDDFAAHKADLAEIANLATPHPFDSHPPLHLRLENVGESLEAGSARTALVTPGDGRWFDHITGADEMESQQWLAYEDWFRASHEESLAWRYVPTGTDQIELVTRYFPDQSFTGKDGDLTINYEQMTFPKWDRIVPFNQIDGLTIDDNQVLSFSHHVPDEKAKTLKLKLKKFDKDTSNQVVNCINTYFARTMTAIEYQKHKAEKETAVVG